MSHRLDGRRGRRQSMRGASAPPGAAQPDREQDIDTFLENVLSDGRQRFRRKISSSPDGKVMIDMFESSAACYDMLQMEERVLSRKLDKLCRGRLKLSDHYDHQKARLRYELEVHIKPKSVNLDQLTIPEVKLASLYRAPGMGEPRSWAEEARQAPMVATWIPIMAQSRNMRPAPGTTVKYYSWSKRNTKPPKVDWSTADWFKYQPS